MSKIFFDSLIPLDDVISELDMYSVESEERQELIVLIDEIVQHHVLNIILSRLPTDHHQHFINLLITTPHDEQIWLFLKTHAGEDIKDHVKGLADKVKSDVKKEIHKAKIKR